MKRVLSLLLTAVMFLTACGAEREKTAMSVAVMTGPTAIGMINVMKDAEDCTAKNDYDFQVYGTPDEIATKLVKGELDAACIPSNLAAVLYNKTGGEICVAAINTLGVLYIAEIGNTIDSVSDLKGRKILTTGQGTTPEYTLRHMLEANGLDPDRDVDIVFFSEAAEACAALGIEGDVAMLPQPYVTSAMMKNADIRLALDVTKEWEAADDSTVVTGVLAVRRSFAKENKDALDTLLSEYKKSTELVNKNVSEAAELTEHFGIFKAAVAEKAIPFCNVTFIDGKDAKEKIGAYLKVLFDADPSSVGGKLPGDDFYY